MVQRIDAAAWEPGADLLVVMGVHRTPVRRKFLNIIALFDHVCTP
jgi:hypothetical protein